MWRYTKKFSKNKTQDVEQNFRAHSGKVQLPFSLYLKIPPFEQQTHTKFWQNISRYALLSDMCKNFIKFCWKNNWSLLKYYNSTKLKLPNVFDLCIQQLQRIFLKESWTVQIFIDSFSDMAGLEKITSGKPVFLERRQHCNIWSTEIFKRK